ncbi:28S ribosomal protein S11, mitochondrial-like [Lytechinus variegatus]|uniref:28S ribosomal protein S11, mitochondrial-like n=1 Tax=Lytechinus variegatus TaxID=7654 RepID=UPI001BB25F01|nr:28S ribosomal protein S11, mitochondrial-like [Lytechinus variegatus]XP_041465491.1 28S ribosomal protein S11, mitochondrial-like [Lytechinus variegatus]
MWAINESLKILPHTCTHFKVDRYLEKCLSFVINGTGWTLVNLVKTFIAPSDTNLLIFNGIPYDQLPIVNIKATYNNTHISVADHTGRTIARTSCGTEGFKNAKKGTAIAAQTAAIAAASKALDKGMNTVRIVIKGIGPGRQTSIKGLQMGGLDIVSITDNTPVPHNGCRPRKARRL